MKTVIENLKISSLRKGLERRKNYVNTGSFAEVFVMNGEKAIIVM